MPAIDFGICAKAVFGLGEAMPPARQTLRRHQEKARRADKQQGGLNNDQLG
jgi:hypothetical protein